MKKYNYAEARREIIDSGINLGAGDFIDVPALQVAADALAKLSKVPAMKDHERIFFSLCYGLRASLKPRAVVNLLADTIPHKRCWYYLRKWGNLGFYNYGVTEDLGWFELDKIPQRYLEIVKEQTVPAVRVVLDPAAFCRALADKVNEDMENGKLTMNGARAIFGLPPV